MKTVVDVQEDFVLGFFNVGDHPNRYEVAEALFARLMGWDQ